MIIALILTVVSMIDYIYNARAVFTGDDQDGAKTNEAYELVNIAKENNLKIGCAESLTSGLVASKIGSVPGASKVFAGGIVSYMYSIKEKILNVDSIILKEKGAVNEETAKQMAIGAREKLACDYCVSTTGIAGPDKDEFGTPVGTVFIACANKANCESKKLSLKGTREQIRQEAANEAVRFLKTFLKN